MSIYRPRCLHDLTANQRSLYTGVHYCARIGLAPVSAVSIVLNSGSSRQGHRICGRVPLFQRGPPGPADLTRSSIFTHRSDKLQDWSWYEQSPRDVLYKFGSALGNVLYLSVKQACLPALGIDCPGRIPSVGHTSNIRTKNNAHDLALHGDVAADLCKRAAPGSCRDCLSF